MRSWLLATVERSGLRWTPAAKLALAVGSAFALIPATASASPLSEAAEALEPGQWTELQTTGLTNDLLTNGNPSSYILQYSDEAVWDPNTGRIMYMGTPHTPYEGSGKFIRYDERSNGWETPTQPPFIEQLFWHGYDHHAMDVAEGRMLYRHNAQVYSYDTTSETWDSLPDIPAGSNTCCSGFEYFPELGKVVYVDALWGVWLYDGSWEHVANTGVADDFPGQPNYPMSDQYQNVARYSPVHQVVVFGGGNGSTATYRMDDTGQVEVLPDAPVSYGINQTVFVVDPVTGNYLLFTNDAGQYELDPVKGQWFANDIGQPFSNIGPDGPTFGTVAAPISTYGVIAFVNYAADESTFHLYKHEQCEDCPKGGETGDDSADSGDPTGGATGGNDDTDGSGSEAGDGDDDDGVDSGSGGNAGETSAGSAPSTAGDATDGSAGADDTEDDATGCQVGGRTNPPTALWLAVFGFGAVLRDQRRKTARARSHPPIANR